MEPFVQTMGERHDLPPFQIIGGNGAAALLNEDTVIDLGKRTITAPAACDLPRIRADGSLRDMDTLVLSTDPKKVEAVGLLGEELLHGDLKVSVFGLKSLADLERQCKRPFSSTARVFLADRYVAAEHDERLELVAAEGFKALYPFRAPIGAETLETFELSIEGRIPIPTSHPGATILNYLTRSISGLRAKDVAKVETMTENILTRYPDVRAWIHDGPGRSMLHLARILHTLREPRNRARTLRLGTQLAIAPYALTDLNEHPGFMASQRSRRVQRLIVETSHVKSRLLGGVEANAAIVSFWQKHIEDRVDRVIHNEL